MIGPFSAFVLYAMVWAIVMLILLQTNVRTQGDAGERVDGTHASAPLTVGLKRRVLWATGIAFALWAPLVWLIVWGPFGIDDLRRITGRPV